jgi:large subunit ribosomal protein L35
MPKMKTKSSVKKRFKLTGTGKVKAGVAKKRHNLGNKSQKMKRTSRRTFVLAEVDTPALKRFMPYG